MHASWINLLTRDSVWSSMWQNCTNTKLESLNKILGHLQHRLYDSKLWIDCSFITSEREYWIKNIGYSHETQLKNLFCRWIHKDLEAQVSSFLIIEGPRKTKHANCLESVLRWDLQNRIELVNVIISTIDMQVVCAQTRKNLLVQVWYCRSSKVPHLAQTPLCLCIECQAYFEKNLNMNLDKNPHHSNHKRDAFCTASRVFRSYEFFLSSSLFSWLHFWDLSLLASSVKLLKIQ